ncbi:aminoglycoside phosphotransferase family protein [Streptomyces sp. VRA16 Mangrove soil]|uniref:aminoglycoside phosphotransferase family protein n=1 Tax=Streptomyces sp. VRA16 Mangrove soil TaxID=2817434 RepID=UPI001A9FCD32|nr:aminoglycoside phosphotransferase family protein [Streptomyces sp. VRA16 Mangrove soil]MBO1335285.1 phosphotransferase [Streptomyces sp. VRA16 Mangrove soil]
MIEVPETFIQGTVAREGERGAAWVAELPTLVAELAERWACVPDGDVLHGEVGVVVPVRRGDGTPAVLKVSFPHPGNVHEPDAFEAWGGRGAVRLYARDGDRYAMLLERAGTETLARCGDADAMMTVAGRIGRRLAVPAPPELPRLSDRADEWEEQLLKDEEELAHALPRRAVGAALATVRELGRTQPGTLVHGDLHAGNILRAEREPWLAVDPKGYAGDPAYDAGAALKAHLLFLLAEDDLAGAVLRSMDLFAEAAELDRERVRRWCQLAAVQGAFWARRNGFAAVRAGVGRDGIVVIADRLVESLTP